MLALAYDLTLALAAEGPHDFPLLRGLLKSQEIAILLCFLFAPIFGTAFGWIYTAWVRPGIAPERSPLAS